MLIMRHALVASSLRYFIIRCHKLRPPCHNECVEMVHSSLVRDALLQRPEWHLRFMWRLTFQRRQWASSFLLCTGVCWCHAIGARERSNACDRLSRFAGNSCFHRIQGIARVKEWQHNCARCLRTICTQRREVTECVPIDGAGWL